MRAGFAPKAVGLREVRVRGPEQLCDWIGVEGKLTFSLRRASLTGRAMALEVGAAAAGEEVESDMVMM